MKWIRNPLEMSVESWQNGSKFCYNESNIPLKRVRNCDETVHKRSRNTNPGWTDMGFSRDETVEIPASNLILTLW